MNLPDKPPLQFGLWSLMAITATVAAVCALVRYVWMVSPEAGMVLAAVSIHVSLCILVDRIGGLLACTGCHYPFHSEEIKGDADKFKGDAKD